MASPSGGLEDPDGRLFEATLAGGGGWGLTRGDAAVAAGALLVALAAALALWLGYGVSGNAAESGDGLYAVVQNTAGYYAALPLDEDVTVSVESDLGTNVVEVLDGQVRCGESDCSNQVCVDTGWVSEAGQMIVCLPHELTVQVVADPDDAVPLV